MAKNDTFKSARSGFDDELDIPDFDFDSPMPKDDRKPIAKFARGAMSGARTTATDSAFIRKALKASLPEGYGMAMDMQQEVSRNAKQLYNNVAREIKPSLGEMARAADRLTPETSKDLKKKLKEIGNWADDTTKKFSESDKGDQRERGIAAALAETFKFQQEQVARSGAMEASRQRLQEGIAFARHRDTFGMLNSMNKGISRLAQYQDRVTAVYHKKSLEIQYRHYFVAMDALEEAKKTNAMVMQQLAAITKNTSLPDYVKLTEGERIAGFLRNKFANKAMGGMFGGKADIVGKTAAHAQELMMSKLTSAINVFSMVAMGMDQAADMKDMMKMSGQSKSEFAGEMAGQFGLDAVAGWAGKHVRKLTGKSDKITKGGHMLKDMTMNADSRMTEFKNSDSGDGVRGALLRLVKEFIPDFSIDGKLEKDKSGDLNKPHLYTKQTHKSINEVIPGYLARIFRELQVMRTGDTSIGLTMYDVTKNKFGSSQSAGKNMLDEIVKGRAAPKQTFGDKIMGKAPKADLASASVKMQLDSLLNVLDPDKKLSGPARTAMARMLLKDNTRNTIGSAKRLTDKDTYLANPETAKYAGKLSSQMDKYFGKQSGNDFLAKQNDFTERYKMLGSGIEDTREVIQNMINLGHYDMLEQLGIINADHTAINFDKIVDYHTGAVPSINDEGLAAGKKFSGMKTAPEKASRARKSVSRAAAPVAMPTMGSTGKASNAGLTRAIGAHSSKAAAAEEAAATLGRMEAILSSGFAAMIERIGTIGGGGGSPAAAGGTGNVFNGASVNFANLLKKTTSKMGGLFKFGNRIAMSGLSGAGAILNTGRDLLGIGATGAKGLLSKAAGLRDLYTPGMASPRINALKMQAGRYYDTVAQKVVYKYEDIKGDVIDLDTEKVAIRFDELKSGFFKSEAVGGIVNIGQKLFGKLGNAMAWVGGTIPPIYKMAMDTAKTIIGKARDLLDEPIDVYVVGDKHPALLAIVMRNNGYFNADKTPVDRPGKIKGPVYDENGDTALSLAQLKRGIVDKYGKPIKSPLAKLWGIGSSLARKGLNALRSVGRGIASIGRGAVGLFRGGVKGMMNGFGGGASSGDDQLDMLTNIFHVLDERLPGKKTRAGSWRNAVAGKKTTASTLKPTADAGSGGLLAGLASLFKRKHDDDDDDGIGALDALDAADNINDLRKGRRAGRAGKAAKLARAGSLAKYGKLAASGALVGAAAYGVDGLAGKMGVGKEHINATEDDANWDRMNFLEKIQSGGARGLEKLGGFMFLDNFANSARAKRISTESNYLDNKSMSSSFANMISMATPLGFLTNSLIGGVKATFGGKSALNNFRLTQYGFGRGNDGATKARSLEDMCFDITTFEGGQAKISGKKFDMAKAMGIFGVDKDDEKAVNNWGSWFMARFKPVYVLHMSVLSRVAPNTRLVEVDSLPANKKAEYLEAVRFSDGPYGILDNPVPGSNVRMATSAEVEEAYKLAKADANEGQKGAKENGAQTVQESTQYDSQGNVIGSAGTAAAAAGFVPNMKNVSTSDGGGSNDSGGGGTIGGIGAAPVFRSADAIYPLEGIRMRAYGLQTLEMDKLSAIRQLEDFILTKVVYAGNGAAQWKGSFDTLMAEGGRYFGVSANSSSAQPFLSWFKNRFLPVFLTYLGLLKTAAGQEAKPGLVPVVEPAVALSIGSQIAGTSGIWSVTDSPWPDYPLATDDSIVKPILQKLREKAKNSVGKEEVLVKDASGTFWKTLTGNTDANDTVKNVPNRQAVTGSANPDTEDQKLGQGGGGVAAAGNNNTGSLNMAGGPLYDGRNASAYLQLAPGVSLDGMNSALMKNFNGMVDEYGKMTGKNVLVTSGFRTYAQQAAMKKKYPGKAASPGSSLHEAGLALDVAQATLNDMDKLGLMRKYGFTRPVGGEPWHMEPAGIQGDVTAFKNNAAAANAAITNSVGKGGGGLGTLAGSRLGSRDAILSQKIMDASVPAKDSGKADAPVIPGATQVAQASSSTPTFDAMGNQTGVTSTLDTEPQGGGKGGGYMKGVGNLAQSVSNPGAAGAFAAATPGTGGQYSKLPDSVGGKGWAGNKDLIIAAAKMAGVDPKIAASVTAIESGFDPMAKASGSTASGLNQFTDGTWKETLGKYGSKYGVPANASPFDPKANALMGAEYMKANLTTLAGVKKDLTGTDAYLAHFLGAGGAKSFLGADPNAVAANIVPAAARSNPSIFYNGNRARTVSEVYSFLNTKMQTSLQQHGVDPSFASVGGALSAGKSSTTAPVGEMQFDAMGNATGYAAAPDTTPTPSTSPARSAISAVAAPRSDIGGFNMNSPQQVQQNPRADIDSAMGKAVPILEAQLGVQTEIRDMFKMLVNRAMQQVPGAAPQPPAIDAPSGSDRYDRSPKANVPVPLKRQT